MIRCDIVRGQQDGSTSGQLMSEDESLTDGNFSEDEDVGLGQDEDDRSHDFIRTHFHSATLCDFCKKKASLHLKIFP